MQDSEKNRLLKEFGAFLKHRRIKVLKEVNLLQFSYSSNLDNSKLRKIERGEVDFRMSTLIELVKTYKLTDKQLFGYKFVFEDNM